MSTVVIGNPIRTGYAGLVFEARGQYAEAEAAYRRAEAFRRATLQDSTKMEFPPAQEEFLQDADAILLSIARNESKQGRLSEAEADARRALLEILDARGKYSPPTPHSSLGSPAFWSSRAAMRMLRN